MTTRKTTVAAASLSSPTSSSIPSAVSCTRRTTSASTTTTFSTAATTFAASTILLLLLAATTPAAAAVTQQRQSLRGGLGLIKQQQQVVKPQAASASAAPFPPQSACERTAGKSPLRLSLDAVASDIESGSSLRRYCFRLDAGGACDPTAHCCDPASASSRTASKLEFDVVAGCSDAVARVTVNGQPSLYMYDTELGVLRIAGFYSSSGAAPEASDQVCVFLDAASSCPTLSQLCTSHGVAAGTAGPAGDAAACRYALHNADGNCCPVSFVATRPPLTPPPPPPPPPTTTTTAATTTTTTSTTAATATTTSTTSSATAAVTTPVSAWGSLRSDFPYCQCRRDAAGSRLFATASPNVTDVAGGLTRICFDVGLREACPDPSSKCCDFTLYKMEIEVDRACADSLAYTTINGIQHVRYFQTAPHAAIKIVNLDRAVSAVNGTRVCLFMRPECNSLAKLCAFHDGTCTVGLFNKPSRGAGVGGASCCPLSTVSI